MVNPCSMLFFRLFQIYWFTDPVVKAFLFLGTWQIWSAQPDFLKIIQVVSGRQGCGRCSLETESAVGVTEFNNPLMTRQGQKGREGAL